MTLLSVESPRAFIDTNVIIRHLTGDPPDQAARATAYLAEAEQLLLADLILAEVVYVLESFYEVERHEVATLARSVITFPAITTLDERLLLRSLDIYETHRIDYAEAYIAACAERAGVQQIVSFDLSLDRVGTVARIEP
ncbi:MAG: PIN domain-containing protein [bacterium]|nr:PIN domain-containing protein [bacterium]